MAPMPGRPCAKSPWTFRKARTSCSRTRRRTSPVGKRRETVIGRTLFGADFQPGDNQGDDDQHAKHDSNEDEHLVDLVTLLREGRAALELDRTRALIQITNLHSLRQHHRLVERLLGGRRCRRSWNSRSRGRTRAHLHTKFDLTQSENLARLQDGFFNLLSIDERAIGGIEVLDHEIISALNDFAMMAGNRLLKNLKRIVLEA